MATFTKDTTVEVEETVSVDIDITVDEFYRRMDDDEMIEMSNLLRNAAPDYEASDVMENIECKQKFYKDLAYHVGVTDSEHLDALITELQYWRK